MCVFKLELVSSAIGIIEWKFWTLKFPTVFGKNLSDRGALKIQSGEERASSKKRLCTSSNEELSSPDGVFECSSIRKDFPNNSYWCVVVVCTVSYIRYFPSCSTAIVRNLYACTCLCVFNHGPVICSIVVYLLLCSCVLVGVCFGLLVWVGACSVGVGVLVACE